MSDGGREFDDMFEPGPRSKQVFCPRFNGWRNKEYIGKIVYFEGNKTCKVCKEKTKCEEVRDGKT